MLEQLRRSVAQKNENLEVKAINTTDENGRDHEVTRIVGGLKERKLMINKLTVQVIEQELKLVVSLRRLRDGPYNEQISKRYDLIAAIALTKSGDPDAPGAALKMLAHVQSIGDYNAIIVSEEDSQILLNGREQSDNPVLAQREAPAWPLENGGYKAARHLIEKAASMKCFLNTDEHPDGQNFYDWAEEPRDPNDPTLGKNLEHARILLPAGDIVFPALFVAAPPRKGKSLLLLALVWFTIRFGSDAMISVAPDKEVPMGEIMNKINQLGWDKLQGYVNIFTTVNTAEYKKMSFDEKVEAATESNLFIYASDTKDDCKLAAAVTMRKKELYRPVSHFHDEADTLVKILEKDVDAVTCQSLLRPLFATCNGLTFLCGATLIATFQETAIWGTLPAAEGSQSNPLAKMLPPLEPPHVTQYVGINNMQTVAYDKQDGPYQYTPAAIKRAMVELRPKNYQKQLDRLYKYLQEVSCAPAKLRRKRTSEANPEPVLETQADADARKESMIVMFTDKISQIDGYKADPKTAPEWPEVPQEPCFPAGICRLWIDELSTATIYVYLRRFMYKDPVIALGDSGNNHINQMLIAMISNAVREGKHDPAAGCTGVVQMLLDMAVDMQKPVAVLLYAAVSVSALKQVIPHVTYPASMPRNNPVKLFQVAPHKCFANGSTELVYQLETVSCHASSEDAFKSMHALYEGNGLSVELKNVRVVCDGYRMFSCGTTLTHGGLKLTGIEGSPPVQYTPKYMALCHTPSRQLNTLLQMTGRGMNDFLNFVIEGYEVEVLTHLGTLTNLRVYAAGENRLVQLMKGSIAGEDTKYIHNLLCSANLFMKMEAINRGISNFSEHTIGFRRLTLSKTFEHHPASDPAAVIAEGDFVVLPDGDEGAAADAHVGASSNDDDDAVLVVIDEFIHPHYDAPIVDDVGDGTTARFALIAKCTTLERDAVQPHTEGNAAAFLNKLKNSVYRARFPDLAVRFRTTWFRLNWKLHMRHRMHGNNSEDRNTALAAAKKTAFKHLPRIEQIIKYFIVTKQFDPGAGAYDEPLYDKLVRFYTLLGKTVEERKERLNKMARALSWNTTEKRNRINNVNQLLIWGEFAIHDCYKKAFRFYDATATCRIRPDGTSYQMPCVDFYSDDIYRDHELSDDELDNYPGIDDFASPFMRQSTL